MKWIVFVLIVVITFLMIVCYSLCVIAGEADEDAKRMYEEMFPPCNICVHRNESWASEACDGCCGAHSNYEPIEGSEINGERGTEILG